MPHLLGPNMRIDTQLLQERAMSAPHDLEVCPGQSGRFELWQETSPPAIVLCQRRREFLRREHPRARTRIERQGPPLIDGNEQPVGKRRESDATPSLKARSSPASTGRSVRSAPTSARKSEASWTGCSPSSSIEADVRQSTKVAITAVSADFRLVPRCPRDRSSAYLT